MHAVTQAIVSLQEDTDDETAVDARITIYVEPAEFSPIRSSHTVPRWLVDGLKTYYLEARPHFLLKEGLDVFTRVFADDTRTVRTHRVFVNSNGSTHFKVRQLCDQFKDTVKTQISTQKHLNCFKCFQGHNSFYIYFKTMESLTARPI